MNYALREGDQPLLQTTIKKRSDGTVQDLTSLTTRQIRYWQNREPSTTTDATLEGAASAGTIKYQIASALQPGMLYWEWVLSDGTNPNAATDQKGRPFSAVVDNRR